MRNLRDLPERSLEKFTQMLLEQQGDSNYWPDDEEFHKAWLTQPIYRSSKSQGRIEAMLRAIEEAGINDRGEKILILGSLIIEHVLPQSWEEHWPLIESADPLLARTERDVLLHTFGNLTLLTQKLNAFVSNGPYRDKRSEIARQSKLSLNSYFQTCGAWDESAICIRGEKLYKVAVRE